MGSESIRKIQDRKYVYYIYYDNKKRKEVCCGLVDDPKTKSKLRNAKLIDLRQQKNNITLQIKKLNKK